MNNLKKFSAVLTLSCLCSGFAYSAEPAVVAKVTEANGKVLVNKGKGLVSTKAGTELLEGNRIVTLDKSNARIVFSDGCELVLEENKILIIDLELGCKAAVLASEPGAGTLAMAGTSSRTTGLIIGGILVGGGAIIAGSGGNNRDNQPISKE